MKMNNEPDFTSLPYSISTEPSNIQMIPTKEIDIRNYEYESTIAKNIVERCQGIEDPVFSLIDIPESPTTPIKEPTRVKRRSGMSQNILRCIKALRKDLMIVNKSISFSHYNIEEDRSQLRNILADIEYKIDQQDYILEKESRCKCYHGCLIM